MNILISILEINLQILNVSGPDILIIAIPHGPLPEDKAKIFISLNLGIYSLGTYALGIDSLGTYPFP